MNQHNPCPPPSIEQADSLTAILVKRFPKKWGAQIKRACEDSFAEFLSRRNSNVTYSIRSGRLLYLAIPKWDDGGGALSLDVEVIYMRAHVSAPLTRLIVGAPAGEVPSPLMEAALRPRTLVETEA